MDAGEFVPPADEETVVLDVHVHSGGLLGGSDGPAGLDGVGARVEGHDFVFVFDVVVNHAFAIGDGVFRPAPHRDSGDDGERRRIDDGGVVGFSVHGENVFGSGIVDDAVGIAAGFDVIGDFERLQIEDNGFVRAAIADEGAAKIGDYSDAVNSFQVGDAAHDSAAIGVDDLDLRIVRNIEAAGGSIKGDVIPIFFAARRRPEIVFLEQVIATLGWIGEREPNDHAEAACSEEIQLERFHRRTPWIL